MTTKKWPPVALPHLDKVHETVRIALCSHFDLSKQSTCPSVLSLLHLRPSLFSSCVNSSNLLIVFFPLYSCYLVCFYLQNNDKIHKERIHRPGLVDSVCLVIQSWFLYTNVSLPLFVLTPSVDTSVSVRLYHHSSGESPANRINCISRSVCAFNCSVCVLTHAVNPFLLVVFIKVNPNI